MFILAKHYRDTIWQLQLICKFLRNDKNKTALLALVQKHVDTAVNPNLATVVVTAVDADLSNDTFDLSDISPCDHDQADTRIFLHAKHAKSKAIIMTADIDVVVIGTYCFQARSQKFAMGGCFGGLEAKPPALENFAFFCKNNLILGLF